MIERDDDDDALPNIIRVSSRDFSTVRVLGEHHNEEGIPRSYGRRRTARDTVRTCNNLKRSCGKCTLYSSGAAQLDAAAFTRRSTNLKLREDTGCGLRANFMSLFLFL